MDFTFRKMKYIEYLSIDIYLACFRDLFNLRFGSQILETLDPRPSESSVTFMNW